MTNVKLTHDYKASPDAIWKKIHDFAGIADWMPGLKCESSNGGKTRRLTLPTGAVIVETLENMDDANRSYGYTIVTSPLPVKNYHSVIKVDAKGSGSSVTWTGNFDAVGPEAAAKAVVEGIYRTGLGAIALAVGG